MEGRGKNLTEEAARFRVEWNKRLVGARHDVVTYDPWIITVDKVESTKKSKRMLRIEK